MTETAHSPKELQLAYKLVNSSFRISFYFWLTLTMVLAAIFSARIYDTNLLLKETFGPELPQYVTLALGIPVGLVLWRYNANKDKRKEVAAALFEEIGTSTEKTATKIISLTKTAYGKSFVALLRAKAQMVAITLVSIFLLFQQLSLSPIITSGTWVYVGFIIVSIITAVIVSLLADRSTRKEIEKLSEPTDSLPNLKTAKE